MNNRTQTGTELTLLQGGRVDRRQTSQDSRLERRRIRRLLGGAGLTAAIAAGVLILSSDDDRTTVVKPGQTLSGIAEQELMRDGNEDPDTLEINGEVRRIVDANRDRLRGDTAKAGTEIKLP